MAHVPVSSPECRTLDPVTEQMIANTSSKNAAKLNILHDRVDKITFTNKIRADIHSLLNTWKKKCIRQV
jgi:hypothetical protein